jgi:hydrogenase maturation protein HypF
MVADLDAARCIAEVSAEQAELLVSPARPVVLLSALDGSPCSAAVAPSNPLIGVMLPYTPIHHLLFSSIDRPLVMTSANHSGQPIIFSDVEVAAKIAPFTGAILTHDRPIKVPCDDSVVRLVGGRLMPIRRARGYAPLPIRMNGSRLSTLAVGGELKNTFCVSTTEHAWVSQHIGDMENLETLSAFEASVSQFCDFYAVRPQVVAADLHPGYLSSKWARTHYPDRLLEVQHHHAHIAAVMAEHECDPAEPVIGIAFDGTGYGDDGTIWGGEVLIADAASYNRISHLSTVLLPGGDSAIKNPYRIALAHLHAAGIAWADDIASVVQLDSTETGLLRRQFEHGFACVPTSSMGRLFDAVASLLGLRHTVTYEAQAAIDLEVVAAGAGSSRRYEFSVSTTTFDAAPVVAGIVDDVRAGHDIGEIARGFHRAVADLVLVLALKSRQTQGLSTVALSGGVFQNALLTEQCVALLVDHGLNALTHRVVPPNDGGLALGQAYVAAHRLDSQPTNHMQET